MALYEARNYFRPHLITLGYHEHKEAFNFDNISNTVIDKAFHLLTDNSVGLGIPQGDHQQDVTTIVRVFKKLYLDTSAGKDQALKDADVILKEVLKVTNFEAGGVINVAHNSTDIVPFGEANDNILMLEMNFNVRVALGIN